jgi:hypothetical protein
MDLLQTILNAQGGGAIQQLSRNFGLSQEQTMSAVESLLPALAAGLQRNTSQEGGIENLMEALSGGSHQRYLDDPSTLAQEETTQDGNGILGHLFGSKEVSRQVAAQAASQTGIGADILKKMLPLLASLAMGALSKRSAASGYRADAAAGQGGILDMVGSLLNSDRGGSIAGDVLGMLGKFMGGR